MVKSIKVEKTKRWSKPKRKIKSIENEVKPKKPRLIDAVAKEVDDNIEEPIDDSTKNDEKCGFILERLAGDDMWNAIRDISNCVDGEAEKDFAQDFLAGGGTSALLLAPLTSEDKVKAVDVAAVFNAVETVVLRVVRDLPQYQAVAMDLVRQVLSDFPKKLVLLISGTNTAYQAKSVLRMLTAFVTLGPLAAREVLMKLNLEHNNWELLPRRSSRRDAPDVRTCFTHFLLAFLVDPHPGVLKEFVDRKTRLSSLFPGLMWDQSETVQLVLVTLRAKILENTAVSRTIKMKLFGSHSIRPLLGLFKWKGPKKGEDEEKDDEKVEELAEVQESVGAFLRSLLASHKYGVIFQDLEVGCGEKNLNPLVSEVLKSIQKPWETPFLSSLVADILAACPDQMPAVCTSLAPHWAPRESQAWQVLAEFLLDIVGKQNSEAFGFGVTSNAKVVKMIVEKVVFNEGLMGDVVKVGVTDENPQVFRKCLQILQVLCRNAENFAKTIVDKEAKDAVHKVFEDIIEKHFPKVEVLVTIWKQELECFVINEQNYALETLEILSFCNKWSKGILVNIEDIISQIEKASQILSTEQIGKIQLEALRLFVSVTKVSGQNSRSFLRKVCTKETFRLLLNLVCSGSEEKVDISKEVLETVLKQGGVLINDNLELEILLAHISQSFSGDKVLDAVSECITDIIENAALLTEEITILSEQLESKEVDKSKNDAGIEDLFAALMSPDFNEEQIESWIVEEEGNLTEPLCSPLFFSLLKKSKGCENEEFVKLTQSCCQTFIYFKEHIPPFCQLLLQNFSHLDDKFIKYVGSVLTNKNPFDAQHFKEFTGASSQVFNKTLLESQALKMLLHLELGCSDSGPELASFISNVPQLHQASIVKLTLNRKYTVSSFDPFAFNPTMTLSVHLLNLAKQLDVPMDEYKSTFLDLVSSKISKLIASEEPVSKSDEGNSVERWFKLFQFSVGELVPLLRCLVESPVGMLKVGCKATILSDVLDGVLAGLSECDGGHREAIEDGLAMKLGCLMEILIDSEVTVGASRYFSTNFSQFLERFPHLCCLMSENLLLVCCKDEESALGLVRVLVKHAEKHVAAFKGWILDNKGFSWTRFLPAVIGLFESNHKEVVLGDKKFIFKLIKRDSQEIGKFLRVKGVLNDVANIETHSISFKYCKYLCDASTSKKQGEVWEKILHPEDSDDNEMDTSEEGDAPKIGAIQLASKFEILSAMQRISGGVDDQIVKELLLPLLHTIGWNIKSSKDDDEDHKNTVKAMAKLCTLAGQIQIITDEKVVAKHLEEQKELWSKFVRWILKYSLKKPDIGPLTLDLLSKLAAIRFKDSDDTEAKLLVTMIQQHSQYLPTLLGKPTDLKTSLVCLLESVARVCPQTCSIDQVPLLLSAYTATLSPTDTALLSLLACHETAGLDLHQYKPFLFSTAAVNHFSIHKKTAGLWKMPKTSEVLSLLNPETMTNTALQFPLTLPLSPHASPSTPSPDLYDPRFVLPLLSHLTSPGVYMDRHLKMVESGALGLAIASLSSRQHLVRSTGYHLLHRIHVQMSASKLAAEKQVWMHLVGLIKNGVALAKSSKTCLRLPSLVTVFLVRSVHILLAPLHPMYRAITGFILAKPALDLYNIPEFLRLLHSREVNSLVEQRWILELIRDGVRDSMDYNLCVKNYVLKLLLSQWNCCLLHEDLQLLLLEVVESVLGLEGPASDLVKGQGLVSWLMVVMEGEQVQEEVVEKVVRIVRRVWRMEGVRDELMVVVRKIGGIDPLVNQLNSS